MTLVRRWIHAKPRELLVPITQRETKHETAAAEQIESDSVLGQAHGAVQRRGKPIRADDDALGSRDQRRRDRQHRGHVPVLGEVVLRDPHRVETHRFDRLGLFEQLSVKLRVGDGRAGRTLAAEVADPELHLKPPCTAARSGARSRARHPRDATPRRGRHLNRSTARHPRVV